MNKKVHGDEEIIFLIEKETSGNELWLLDGEGDGRGGQDRDVRWNATYLSNRTFKNFIFREFYLGLDKVIAVGWEDLAKPKMMFW
jgi:hypothetical protein